MQIARTNTSNFKRFLWTFFKIMFHLKPLRLFHIYMCSLFQVMHHALHSIKCSQRLFKWSILSRDTALCVCICVCVCVWYWLMFSSHIRIPSHPTLQCPLSLSLIAGRVRLSAHMGASEESLLQRGGGDGTGILQLREKDAPGQQAIDRNYPAGPSRNTKVRLRLANRTCKLAAQFKHLEMDYIQSPGHQLSAGLVKAKPLCVKHTGVLKKTKK